MKLQNLRDSIGKDVISPLNDIGVILKVDETKNTDTLNVDKRIQNLFLAFGDLKERKEGLGHQTYIVLTPLQYMILKSFSKQIGLDKRLFDNIFYVFKIILDGKEQYAQFTRNPKTFDIVQKPFWERLVEYYTLQFMILQKLLIFAKYLKY